MNRIGATLLMFPLQVIIVFAQQAPVAPLPSSGDKSNSVTVRGCLDGERGSYIVMENQTNMVYALKGVGSKLDSYLRHEVEVKGRMLTGSVKTGVRSEKAGSNPSDTEHGVDGVPLQVSNVQTDIRMISKHCKAADQQ